MSRVRSDVPLLPSLLDRLMDDEPEVKTEAMRPGHQILRELHRALQRDLHHLLNSRQRCISAPGELSELSASLANYGLPDLAAANMASKKVRERLRTTIEQCIRRFEPRFKTVKVSPLETEEDGSPSLHFRIDALVHAEPVPEPIVFDSTVEPVHREFVLRT